MELLFWNKKKNSKNSFLIEISVYKVGHRIRGTAMLWSMDC
jgi:hypothetical protein